MNKTNKIVLSAILAVFGAAFFSNTLAAQYSPVKVTVINLYKQSSPKGIVKNGGTIKNWPRSIGYRESLSRSIKMQNNTAVTVVYATFSPIGNRVNICSYTIRLIQANLSVTGTPLSSVVNCNFKRYQKGTIRRVTFTIR